MDWVLSSLHINWTYWSRSWSKLKSWKRHIQVHCNSNPYAQLQICAIVELPLTFVCAIRGQSCLGKILTKNLLYCIKKQSFLDALRLSKYSFCHSQHNILVFNSQSTWSISDLNHYRSVTCCGPAENVSLQWFECLYSNGALFLLMLVIDGCILGGISLPTSPIQYQLYSLCTSWPIDGWMTSLQTIDHSGEIFINSLADDEFLV